MHNDAGYTWVLPPWLTYVLAMDDQYVPGHLMAMTGPARANSHFHFKQNQQILFGRHGNAYYISDFAPAPIAHYSNHLANGTADASCKYGIQSLTHRQHYYTYGTMIIRFRYMNVKERVRKNTDICEPT